MGGNAFGPQAARLSIPSHAALEAVAAARLAPFFGPIAAPRAFKSKESHGDLDLIAGWDGVGWETMKGAARGLAATATDGCVPAAVAAAPDVPAVLATTDENCVPDTKAHADTKTSADKQTSTSDAQKLPLPPSPLPQSPPRSPPHSHPPDTECHGTTSTPSPPVCATSPPGVLDAWCARIAAALDGTHWYRSGNEISVAVPADVLGRYMGEGAGSETNTPAGSTPVQSGDAAAAAVPTSAKASRSGTMSRGLPSSPFYQVDILLVPTTGHAFTCFTYGYGAMVLILGHLLRAAAGTRSMYLHAHCALLRTKPFFGIRATDVFLTSDPVELCRWLGLDYAAWIAAGNGWDKEDMFAWFASCPSESRAARGLTRLATYGRSAVVGGKGHKGRMSVLDEMGIYLRDHGWSVPDDDATAASESTPAPKPTPPTPKLDPDNPAPLSPAERGVLTFWDKLDAYAEGVESARSIARELYEAQQRRAALREVERQIAAQEAQASQEQAAKEAQAPQEAAEQMTAACARDEPVEAMEAMVLAQKDTKVEA